MQCNSDAARCTNETRCAKLRYDFEDDEQGWSGDLGADSRDLNSTTSQSSERAHGGRGALRLSFSVDPQRYNLYATNQLCAVGIDFQGKRLQAWVYLSTTATALGTHVCSLYSAVVPMTIEDVEISPNQWILLTTPPLSAAEAGRANSIDIACRFGQNNTTWSGSLFIDDVTVQ